MAKQFSDSEFKIVVYLFFVVSIGITAYTTKVILDSERYSRWPTTKGKVLSKRVEERTYRVRRNRTEKSYYPYITFTYCVNNSTFTNDRIAFFDTVTQAQSQIGDIWKLISADDSVYVYFNPNNPAESMILTTPSKLTTTFFLVAGIFSTLVSGFMVFSMRST